MFKKSLATTFATVAFAATAYAQTPAAPAAPAAPASPHTITGNVGIFSQYIFRGLTQTDRQPALQGGFDYSHSSGFYAGTWLSNISWLKENFSTPPATITGQYASGGSLEWDIYGGYKANFGKTDFTYDLGLLYYYYPGTVKSVLQGCQYGSTIATACPKADTFEMYAAVGWKWITLKYSHGLLNNTFGVPNSRGTNYIDLTADIPLGESGFTANVHYGKQTYKGSTATHPLAATPRTNSNIWSYSDWKVGLTYALPKDFSIGAFASGTSGASVLGYGGINEIAQVAPLLNGPFPRAIGKTTGTVFLKKTF
jgi:uncharacterized protein (TIGR02001 family)